MLSFFLGVLLPKDKADYADSEGWRVIFSMPCIIAFIQIVLLLFVFRQEPIDFCIGNDRNEEAKVLMRKVYKKPIDLDAK